MTSSWLKGHLLCSTIIAGFAAGAVFTLPTNAYAQDSDDPEVAVDVEDAEESADEKLTVTGSRVRRDEFTSASPIQVIDGELARDLGLVDAADLLKQTTVVQGLQTTTAVSTANPDGLATDSGPGSATVSLRGLDAGRTLVLVNGRRLAPAGVRGAPAAPDINMIPASLIQRVDLLLDGASAVYGSDAVAGVANYILRDDFDGLQLDAFITDPEMRRNAGQRQVYSATWGLSNDRGFMGFAAEYRQDESITGREAGSFYDKYAGGCEKAYIYGASGTTYEECVNSFFGAGSFNVQGPGLGFIAHAPGVQEDGLPMGFRRTPISSVNNPGLLTEGNADGIALLAFPEVLDQTLSPEFRRLSMYSLGEYNLNTYGNMEVYYEASYTLRETVTATRGQQTWRVPADYAYNPFGYQTNVYTLSIIDGDTVVDQKRAVVGLRGDLPDMEWGSFKDWSYDIYASYSRSDGTDRVRGEYSVPRYIDMINQTTVDANGNIVCQTQSVPQESSTAPCRALNMFDPNFAFTGRFEDPLDNQYIFPNRMTITKTEQSLISGYLTGTLWELPAGPLGAVFGFEYRDDEIITHTDQTAADGELRFFSSDPGATGSRDLKEAFVEFDIPVFAGKPWLEELSFNAAGRWTEEEFFGAQVTYRLQGRYRPVEWFTFRGSYGTTFRAPNLGEQFGGLTTGPAATRGSSDPCLVPGTAIVEVDDDNDPNTPPIRVYDPSADNRDPQVLQNCINGGGVGGLLGVDPTTLGTIGQGTNTVTFLGIATQVLSGSNPNLEAETSDSLTLGVVFEQPWFDDFDLRFSANYYDITIEGEVSELPSAQIVTECYNSVGLTDAQCNFISRQPEDGTIDFVLAINQNLAERKAEGIDFNLELGHEFKLPWFEDVFNAQAIIRATRSLTQSRTLLEDFDNTLGEYGFPRWRANYTGVVDYGNFRFLWQTRFIDNMIEDNEDPLDPRTSSFSPCLQAGDTPCNILEDAPRYWNHDASLTWRSDTWILRAGVSNVFDDQPLPQTNGTYATYGRVGADVNGRTFFYNVTKAF